MLELVPQDLKGWPNFVGWRYEQRGEDRTKPLFDLKTGIYARVNHSETWTTFEDACARAEGYEGLGFVLSGVEKGGLSLVGIDFDGVVTDGKIDPFVSAILTILGNPYTEYTPSGAGVRAFVYGKLPAGGRRFTRKNPKFGAEIYSSSEPGRYLTLTGNRISGSNIPSLTDLTLPYFLLSNFLDDRFRALWTGSLDEYEGDHSRADLALAGMLVRLLNGDREKAEEWFAYSALGQRDKWQREDYRRRTFEKAVKPMEPQVKFGPGEQGFQKPAPKPALPLPSPGTLCIVNPKEVHMTILNWLWQDRVPFGKLTLFCGNPDNGKSLVTLDVAARVTTGTQFYGCTKAPEKGDVLILAGEDALADTMVPRLVAAGADLDHIQILHTVKMEEGKRLVRLDTDLHAIELHLEANPMIRLVIIDPVSNYLGGVKMTDEQAVRDVLAPMIELAERMGTAILLVMHLNKKSDLDAISRVSGAMAFVGAPRMVWLFVREPKVEGEEWDDTIHMAKMKGNIVATKSKGLTFRIVAKPLRIEGRETWIPIVEWTGIEDSESSALLKGRGNGPAPRVKNLAKEWLQECLTDAPKEVGLIQEEAQVKNFSWSTIERAKKDLGIQANKIGTKWVWSLAPAAEKTVL